MHSPIHKSTNLFELKRNAAEIFRVAAYFSRLPSAVSFNRQASVRSERDALLGTGPAHGWVVRFFGSEAGFSLISQMGTMGGAQSKDGDGFTRISLRS